MKKALIFLSAIAALAAASCTKSNLVTDTPEMMELRPVTGVMSRGVVTGTTFPTDRSMQVSADVMANTGGSGNFFTNRTFSYSGGVWVPSVTTYWPVTGDLDILAYSAGAASVSATWTNATQVVLSCTDCSADDILMGGATNCNKNSKSVAFKHCLTQVKFTAKAGVNTAVKIKKIDITAKKGATLTITKSAGSAATSVATSLTGSATAIRVFSGNTTMTTTAQDIGTPLLIPAQTPSTVTVYYTLTTDGVESPEMSVSKTVTSALAAGSAYTYAIEIGVTEMTLTATLTDWVPASGGSVTIN